MGITFRKKIMISHESGRTTIEDVTNEYWLIAPMPSGLDVNNLTAKSIPAKKYGINTAEPVSMAMRKCPNLIVIDGDMVCLPGDSLVRAAYEELAKADVLSFSPLR